MNGLYSVYLNFSPVYLFPSSYSQQQQYPQQGAPGQYGGMMMNGSMQGGVNGNGAGQMPPMQGQMGMNAMGMGRMPMGPDQVQAALIQLH